MERLVGFMVALAFHCLCREHRRLSFIELKCFNANPSDEKLVAIYQGHNGFPFFYLSLNWFKDYYK